MAEQVCRPYGALNHLAPSPTVETVGYEITSLRDFGQLEIRLDRSHRSRNILGDGNPSSNDGR